MAEKEKTSKGFDWNAVRQLSDDQLLDRLKDGDGSPQEDYTIAAPDGVIIAEVEHHDVSARPEPQPPVHPLPDAPSVRIVDMSVRAVIPKDRPPEQGH
jgi:hypothetical protein